MRKDQKNFIKFVAFLMIAICVLAAYKMYSPASDDTTGPQEPQQEETQTQEAQKPVEKPVEKVYVDVFFIGHNSAHEEVYKAVRREYEKDIDGSKVKFAINSLI